MNKIDNKQWLEISAKGVLWHGVDFFKVETILDRGYFEAHTTQRFWDDGIRRKDNDPEYNNSKWMYGWSMSRDINVSKNFSFIIFACDKKELQKNMKVKPYSWGFSIASGFKHKREKEEFVISGGTIHSENYYKQEFARLEKESDQLFDEMYKDGVSLEEKEKIKEKIKDLENKMDQNNFVEQLTKPKGKKLPVSSAIGFFIDKKEMDFFEGICTKTEKNRIEKLITHPLFLGFV